ncbi:hypothetical protein ACHWQZ_G010485 [Mnemiopsis leidyi]
MAIIRSDPWEEESNSATALTKRTETKTRDRRLFRFQDLASDYYQVLRQTSRPRICRILWGIVTGALLLVTLFTVGSLLQEYFRHESFDKTSTSWKDNLTLPALTICSSNFINYTRLREVMTEEGDSDALEALRRVLSLLERYDGAGDFFELYEANKATFKQLVSYENRRGSIQLRFSLNLDAVIFGTPHYFFDGRGKNITDPRKHMQTTKSGMCLEFNNDETFQQSNGGPKGGFSIDLNTNVRDYLPTTSSHGFTVFIRDPDENVMLNVGGFVISPGTETFVRLTSKSAKRLGPPHGTCKNVPNIYSKRNVKFESIRECWQRQVIQAMIGKCGCIPIYFAVQMWYRNRTNVLDEFIELIKTVRAHKFYESIYEFTSEEDVARYVSMTNGNASRTKQDNMISEIERLKKMFVKSPYFPYHCSLIQERACTLFIDNEITKGKLKLEKCPEPCKYREWDAVISSIPFPPTPTYFNEFMIGDGVRTFADAKENIARLHVFYDKIRVQETEQIPAYQTHNFIAEFGGTVDLFIGFSFFTLFQLIEIGIATCVLRCRKIKISKK